ncbi:hypothetical protein D3C81_1372770 [compost metagenome]
MRGALGHSQQGVYAGYQLVLGWIVGSREWEYTKLDARVSLLNFWNRPHALKVHYGLSLCEGYVTIVVSFTEHILLSEGQQLKLFVSYFTEFILESNCAFFALFEEIDPDNPWLQAVKWNECSPGILHS